ncbi:MAG: hydroxymethylglutaryl-CoA lyase [Myxococcota bacterium]|nr:hydroxymethylglutaryl-CoA lyase [Myxococcota bacterium]
MSFASRVKIVEVGPRDGLQNEPETIATKDKVAFVNLLSEAGLPHIEVTSFVSPRWIPQLADGSEVFEFITKRTDTEYSALVPNTYGLERALDAGVKRIAIFTAASETFNQHNINASIDESLERFVPVMDRAKAEGVWVRGYVSTSFGCPYDGDVPAENVIRVARALDALGVDEVSLGDTHGAAVPSQIPEVIGGVLEHLPVSKIAVHFHDTHGRALANVYSALQLGIQIVDTSAGGLGGCPYAPGASGNLATEDLVVMLNRMNIETGVDLKKLMKASRYMEQILGRRLPSRHLLADACGISKIR